MDHAGKSRADETGSDLQGPPPRAPPSPCQATVDVRKTVGARSRRDPCPAHPLPMPRPSQKRGDPDWIRTSGLQIRNLSLYPAELRGPPPGAIEAGARPINSRRGRTRDRAAMANCRNARAHLCNRFKSMSAKPMPFVSPRSAKTSPHGSMTTLWRRSSAVVVRPELRRRNNEQARFDCSRAEQDMPVSLARRDSECRGNRDDIRIGFGQPLEQGREAKVVQMVRPSLPTGVPLTSVVLSPPNKYWTRASSHRSEDRHRTDGSCRTGREHAFAVDDEGAVGDLPANPSGLRVSRDAPRCDASSRPRGRRPARDRHLQGRDWNGRARYRDRRRPDISGVKSISAPPAAASAMAPSRARAFARRIKFLCETGTARSESSPQAAIRASSLPSDRARRAHRSRPRGYRQ